MFSYPFAEHEQLGAQANNAEADASRHFLDQFVGHWAGEGVADGAKVRDEAEWRWTLNGKFLRLIYRGEGFQAEGYFWHNPKNNRFELYEFNDGKWPARHLTERPVEHRAAPGEVRQVVVLEEKAADRHILIRLEWADHDTFRLTESTVNEKEIRPFVKITFHRQAGK